MFRILLVSILLFGVGAWACPAQNKQQLPLEEQKSNDDDRPMGLQDTLSRMRIEKDKKDFNEMLRRGDDVVKLASELDEGSGSLQREKIGEIGKLVKKIREGLGGEDSDKDKNATPTTGSDGVKALKEAVTRLSEELKKVTRFTVSAAAIERANDVLSLVKYLRG